MDHDSQLQPRTWRFWAVWLLTRGGSIVVWWFTGWYAVPLLVFGWLCCDFAWYLKDEELKREKREHAALKLHAHELSNELAVRQMVRESYVMSHVRQERRQ